MKTGSLALPFTALFCMATSSFAGTQWSWSLEPTVLSASGVSEESFSVFIKVQNSSESSASINLLGFNLADGSFGTSAGVLKDSAGNPAVVAVIPSGGPSSILNPGEEVSWNAFNLILYPTYDISAGIARNEQFILNPNFYVQVADGSYHTEYSAPDRPLTLSLSPAPESGTSALMLLGLVGITFASRLTGRRSTICAST